jgi:hypothetical protein
VGDKAIHAMWKINLGILGLVCGVPFGLLVGCVVSLVLADRYRINWFHGDDRLSWVIPLFLLLGPVLGGGFGVMAGSVLDRARARRHRAGPSAEPGTAADGGRDTGSSEVTAP